MTAHYYTIAEFNSTIVQH